MKISDNINYVLEPEAEWRFFTNKSYLAKIQKSDPTREYNVEGQNGVVYNFLEDSFEKVMEDGYIITGAAGEMWPISASALKKYDISPADITEEPQDVYTIEYDTVYAGIQIPIGTEFFLETDYGYKAMLKGNRKGIAHGGGDYILVEAKYDGTKFSPDFSDCGRIINGTAFHTLYRLRRV